MDYSTYWSILDTPSKTIQSSSVFLWIALAAGLLWFLTKKFKNDSGDGNRTNILWATVVFGVLGAAGFVALTFFYPDKTNEKTLEMLNSSTTPKVEGVISNFERTFRNARYGGETIEKFSVDSIQFAYGDAALGKFNSFTHTNNKVIFNGQKVRITYKTGSPYGNDFNSILRIEIAK
jgi:hypothetical protein